MFVNQNVNNDMIPRGRASQALQISHVFKVLAIGWISLLGSSGPNSRAD